MLFISGYYYSMFEFFRDIRCGGKGDLSRNSFMEISIRVIYTHIGVMFVNHKTWTVYEELRRTPERVRYGTGHLLLFDVSIQVKFT